ncbi:MAG TPA: winged helix-turn-helix domain-containing protein [Burkholderiaceae bacterium]|jgi:molybdate transport system regulatory protein
MPPKPSPTAELPSTAPRRSRAANAPVVKFRLRVSVGDVIAIGPGKVTLLEAIAETGSITAAAKSLEMSYRRAWMLLDELNRALEHPAVDSAKGGQHGGGSALTDTGRALIELYRRVESTAARACAADLALLTGLIAR